MHLLFITRLWPWPPHAGDLRYTADLITALSAQQGIQLSVFCGNGLPEAAMRESASSLTGVSWFGPVGGHVGRAADLRSLVGSWPRAATRAMPPAALRELSGILTRKRPDAVILNESCTAPALDLLRKAGIPAFYVSHNVDADIRPAIAAGVKKAFVGWLQRQDAEKYRRMELALLSGVQGMTAITAEDQLRYRVLAPDRNSILMTPGYFGPFDLPARPMADRGDVAVLVGSFEWNAKIANLREILAAYARHCAAEKETFALRIAGKMSDPLRAELRETFPDVEFTGAFGALGDVVADARYALVLETAGGGFKLKTLDYIFSHLPIVAYPHAMAGTGLEAGRHYLAVTDADAAMERIHGARGEYAMLEAMASSAYAKARDAYNWDARASALCAMVAESTSARRERTPDPPDQPLS